MIRGDGWIAEALEGHLNMNSSEGLKYHRITIIKGLNMASTEDDIKSLIRSRFYATKEEVISDAVKALLVQKPELKKEIAPGSKLDREIAGKPPIEDRMKILENYVGIVKLKKPFTLEEIFELEEDNWLY